MSTDAKRCKVCGGPFAAKRIIIDGMAYHERCSLMSYPPHTYEDYARLSERNDRLVAALAWMETHDPELVETARSKFGIQQSTEKP